MQACSAAQAHDGATESGVHAGNVSASDETRSVSKEKVGYFIIAATIQKAERNCNPKRPIAIYGQGYAQRSDPAGYFG